MPYPVPEITPDNVRTSPELVTEIVLLPVRLIAPAKLLVASFNVPPAKVIGLAPTLTF